MPGTVTLPEAAGQAVVPADADFGIVVIGGSTITPIAAGLVSPPYGNPTAMSSDYGIGDGIDAATQAGKKTPGNPAPPPVSIYRTPPTTDGDYGTIDVTLVTGTCVPAEDTSTSPKGTYQARVQVYDDGNEGAGTSIGTSGIVLRASVSNGSPWLPLTDLGTATSFSIYLPAETPIDTGVKFKLDPASAQVTAFVAAAVEARTDTLAHLADVTAHDGADTSAAQIALAASSAPTTGATAWAVMNLCRLALASHESNITAHNGPDGVNVVAHAAATTTSSGVSLYIEYKADFNLHLGIALAADDDGLLVATASSVAVQTYLAAALLAPGLAVMATYARRVSFTTAGGTAADAPATATIIGTDYLGAAQTESVNVPQTATVAFSVGAYKTITSIVYSAGQGTGATVAIGYGQAVHNSADVTNVLAATTPVLPTLKTGDEWSIATTPPMWGASDLYAAGPPPTGAFAAIAESDYNFAIVAISEPVTASDFPTVQAGLNYCADFGKEPACLVRFRDPTAGETDSAYILAFRAFAAACVDDRVSCVAGSGRLTDVLRGYVYHRSGLPALLARFQGNSVIPGKLGERITQHPGFVGRGALENFSLVDTGGNLVGHDEQVRGGIDGPVGATGGGITFYRVPNPDITGTYVSAAPTLHSSTSTILTFMDRRLANGIKRAAAAIAWLEIQGADVFDPVTFELDPDLRDGIAAKIASAIAQRYGGDNPEFQNYEDPNLVTIDPTVTVIGSEVSITGSINVRFYGYTKSVTLTFRGSR